MKHRNRKPDLSDARPEQPRPRSARPGTPAPEFELELLDEKGTRTGETRILSDYLDKPVALIFGSYT